MYRFYRVVDEYRTSFRCNLPSSVTIKYIEISSDGDVEPGSAATAAAAASSRRTHTQDLLRNKRARIRIDEMKSSSDLEVMIHQLWPCTEPDCSNHENYCWVHPRTRLHYKIETIDVETWVPKCQIGNLYVSPSQLPVSVNQAVGQAVISLSINLTTASTTAAFTTITSTTTTLPQTLQ
ncbi:hypothetical protein K469DRAFT_708563 [Zopfia rhizophila CBS 207.26]|uniref:Uncharacterized protein n=1 Tax=Zopfia rhizophila CBS 207.26 TaxID=1314779 RepID=A0A6A6E0N3_9PEZI|nr:hypothetical protein K469DRAFT_708563 [Zopfia rhizophila CBS 207.26]